MRSSLVAGPLVAVAVLGGALAACQPPASADQTANPSVGGCSLDVRSIDGGPALAIRGNGYPPDRAATLAFDDGGEEVVLDNVSNPALHADIRGVVLFELGVERRNVGPMTFRLSAGGCTASATVGIVEAMFPPACPEGPAVASGGPAADGYAALVMADRPVAYWRFEEDDGPILAATAGEPAAIQGAGVFGQPGPVAGSRALGLRGDGAWVDVPDIDVPGDVTIEGWMYFCNDDISSADALTGGPEGFPNLNFFEGRFRAWTGDEDVAVAPEPLELARWYHLAMTREAGTIRLWVDGVPVAEGMHDGAFAVARLGNGGETLAGMLDEVAIFDHVVSAESLSARAAARS